MIRKPLRKVLPIQYALFYSFSSFYKINIVECTVSCFKFILSWNNTISIRFSLSSYYYDPKTVAKGPANPICIILQF